MLGEEDADGTVRATGAGAAIPLSTLFDPSGSYPLPGWLRTVRSVIALTISADGSRVDATFGGAVDPGDALDAIARPMTPVLDATAATDGWIRDLDRDQDGTITLEEVKTASITQTLLAADLDIAGKPALSFGLAIRASR